MSLLHLRPLSTFFDPHGFLVSCRRLLAPGGLLVVTCPSMDGFDILTLGIHSDTIDHEHVNYFSPSSIRRLAEASGFDVLEIQTPGQLDADIVRNKVMTRVINLDTQPWLHHILFDCWETVGPRFQEFLVANQMSTHMWMIASAQPSNGTGG